MKKFITIIVAFMSVLTLWGQTDEEKDIKAYLDFFQTHKEEVIRQALTKNLIQNQDTVLITRVINDAVYLCNNYDSIATINGTLSSEIERELTDFCRTYFKNIAPHHKFHEKEYVQIHTPKFLQTIQSYQGIFQSLRRQVESILETPINSEIDQDVSEAPIPIENSDPVSQPQDTTILYVLLILNLIVGTASIIFVILALRKVNSTNKNYKETKINKTEEAASSSIPRH